MYGLRTAPRSWQDHFAWVLLQVGFTRLKSDSNVYLHTAFMVVLVAYVDDLMMFGLNEKIILIVESLKEHLLIKATGNLNTEGARVRFLGRWFQRVGSSLHMYEEATYYNNILKDMGLESCRSASTPGPS